MKLLKGNMLFVEDPKVLEFIEHCKEKYSDKIKQIRLKLYDEEDANGDEWMMTVQEPGGPNESGMVWVPWHIPTTYSIIEKHDNNERNDDNEEIDTSGS